MRARSSGHREEVAAVALDLGSTRIKAGLLAGDRDGFTEILSVPAPRLRGKRLIREGDAELLFRRADAVLRRVLKHAPSGLPLGVSSQRSSFVLWDRSDGRVRTPLISWQDRRAEPWCTAHREREAWIRERTGLPLSPHYAGPKLAWIFKGDAALRRQAENGRLLFGTLETFCLWRWSRGEIHRTDASMAARTLLADARRGGWSEELLEFFGIPANFLPEIKSSSGNQDRLANGTLAAASLSDQAAGALALLGPARKGMLVSLGTGGFVLRPSGSDFLLKKGYLTGPLLANATLGTRYALEGTINGCAGALALAPGPATRGKLPPRAFCLPDLSGVGAPHWRPDLTLTLSPEAQGLKPSLLRRVIAEGIAFRVREIAADLCHGRPQGLVRLAGGLAHDPLLANLIAGALGMAVEIPQEPEASLLGAAFLAAGRRFPARLQIRQVAPPKIGNLEDRYRSWKAWLTGVLVSKTDAPFEDSQPSGAFFRRGSSKGKGR